MSDESEKKLRQTLADPQAYATSLLTIALDRYGTELFDWEPDSLWMALAEDLGTMLPRVNQDKVQALITLLTTDLPLVSVELFNATCNVLSGSEANFATFDVADVDEILWGMYEMMLHLGIDLEQGERPPEFSHEVRRFIGVVLQHAGVTDPPDLLRLAEMETDNDIEQWVDDPEMFNGLSDLQQTKKQRLIEGLAERLLGLVNELNGLPLNHRNPQWHEFRTALTDSASRLVSEYQHTRLART